MKRVAVRHLDARHKGAEAARGSRHRPPEPRRLATAAVRPARNVRSLRSVGSVPSVRPTSAGPRNDLTEDRKEREEAFLQKDAKSAKGGRTLNAMAALRVSVDPPKVFVPVFVLV